VTLQVTRYLPFIRLIMPRITPAFQGMQAIKGIIFDLDGVLLHSSPLHEQAFREALDSLPIREFTYGSVAGMRTDEAIRTILAENGIQCCEKQLMLIADKKSRIARDLIASHNPIEPRCKQILAALSRLYRLGLASSGSEATVDLFLSRNGLREMFSCILHGGDVPKAKPSPQIYELACQRMHLAPQECLVIEDAAKGVQAAKAAGAMVWGIPTTCAANELTLAGADSIIYRLDDLLALAERG
jgi:beta-phosphoglucomutase